MGVSLLPNFGRFVVPTAVSASCGTPEIKEVYDVTRKAPVVRIVLITALVLVLAVVPGALAAKPAANRASITFNPATVVVGQQYRVNGSGFKPNTWLTVGAHDADVTWWNSGVTMARAISA
jgi:hypothetical protein